MERYRSLGPGDEPSLSDGDREFIGINQLDAPENLKPGEVQSATNMDFSNLRAETRGGFVCLPALGRAPFGAVSHWEAWPSASNRSWSGVAYGLGRFVSVSSDGGGVSAADVMYSTDGELWTGVVSGIGNQWQSIAVGSEVFVAVGNSGSGNRIMTSNDVLTWTARTSPADITWQSVAYGNETFVAVATDGGAQQVMTSTDRGVTWVRRNTPSSAQNTWRSVTYGDGLFVAVSDSGTGNRVMTSSDDGVTWVARTSGADNAWQSVTYGRGRFVAISDTGGTASAMTSDDGITWVLRNTPDSLWHAVTFGNGIFVAVSDEGDVTDGRVMSSPDGVNWSSGNTVANLEWDAIAHGNDTFVSVSRFSGIISLVQTAAGISVFASGVYSDPNDAGSQWIVLVGNNEVGFHSFGRSSRTVPIANFKTVEEPSTVVQCNNQVYIFRGADEIPLYWDGNWSGTFTVAPTTPAPGAGFTTIPYSKQATYYQNRLWVIDGKDSIAASDVLDFVAWDEIAEEFNLNTGSSDYLVTTYPFGDGTLIVFKNNSILALNGVGGSLEDVSVTEITRTVGCIGMNAVTTVGPDLVYCSDRNINLLSLTSTNNALQHKTLPLSSKIQPILKRVNWEYASKVSMAYWDNKLYVALPLDNATSCSSIIVYNFLNEHWYGEWNFDSQLGMVIQGWVSANYLGAQRLHCVTEDGRVFVVGEGHQDISGTTTGEVSTSLTTRAYRMGNNNRVTRRMYADLETNRPCFSITAFSEGVNESSTILTDRTYSRSQSWLFNDSTYTLSNSGDNYNRAYRKDYAGYCSDNIQARSGFQPEMLQSSRIVLPVRRKGRLAWFQITNTTGRIVVNGVGSEARAGDRGNFVQVG